MRLLSRLLRQIKQNDNLNRFHRVHRWTDNVLHQCQSQESGNWKDNVLDRFANFTTKLRQVDYVDTRMNFFTQLDFGQWAKGLLAAFIGGGSGAFSAGLSSMVVDPLDFNIYTAQFWKLIFGTFVISGLVPFFAYLHQNPVPDTKEVEKTTKTVSQGSAAPVTSTPKGKVPSPTVEVHNG